MEELEDIKKAQLDAEYNVAIGSGDQDLYKAWINNAQDSLERPTEYLKEKLGETLVKAKYLRREGTKGKYKYVYAEKKSTKHGEGGVNSLKEASKKAEETRGIKEVSNIDADKLKSAFPYQDINATGSVTVRSEKREGVGKGQDTYGINVYQGDKKVGSLGSHPSGALPGKVHELGSKQSDAVVDSKTGGSKSFKGFKMDNTVQDARKEVSRMTPGNGRVPVIVAIPYAKGKASFGAQMWTPEMVKQGKGGSADFGESVLVGTKDHIENFYKEDAASEKKSMEADAKAKAGKSDAANKVLELMDSDEDGNYMKALNTVLRQSPSTDRAKLEKELDKYI